MAPQYGAIQKYLRSNLVRTHRVRTQRSQFGTPVGAVYQTSAFAWGLA
jgi:hypothetical protein